MARSRVAEKSSRWPPRGVVSSSRRTAGRKPEVGHVVGLVEHGDLDGVELAVALTDEVLEPAGAGDDDVGAAAQAQDLRVLADPAVDRERGEARGRGERAECLVHLAGELAGRDEDQRARPLGLRAAAGGHEAGDERQQERVGLAAAGAAAAEHVLAGEGVGERRGLDGRRRGDAGVLEDGRRVGWARRDRRKQKTCWSPKLWSNARRGEAACAERPWTSRCFT